MNELDREILKEIYYYLDENTFHQIFGEEESYDEFKNQSDFKEFIDCNETCKIQNNDDEVKQLMKNNSNNIKEEKQVEEEKTLINSRNEDIKEQTSKNKFNINQYRVMRMMWLGLKCFQKQYGDFSFSSDNLNNVQLYEELLEYYDSILNDKRGKIK